MWNNQGGYDQGGGYGDTGGGYINSPGFGSPQQSQEKRSRQRVKNIVPCSVAQILKAEQVDDVFMLDGTIPLHQVIIVGLVRTVNETPTRLEYHIDDMTGPPLQVRQFLETDENTPEEERTMPMRENTLVRVFGNVRSFQNQISVAAFNITAITDMNQLTTHLLEVVHSHLWWTKSQQAGGGGGGGGQVAGYTPAGDAGGGYAGAQAEPMMGLNRTHSQVELAIRNCRDEQGISIQEIGEHLRGIPQAAIREAVEFLSSEGHIYSTIDDEHYKSTESGD